MMKMTKKQKDMYLKVATIAAIALVAYFVFKNMREAVGNTVTKQVSKNAAKDTVGQAKGMKRQAR